MIRRYVTLWSPVGEWTGEPQGSATMDVFERDRSPRPTGLVDAKGRELFAVDERGPVGFLRLDEAK
jgi:hypothetical protein